MARIKIETHYLERLAVLDAEIKVLNDAKVKVLFEAIGLPLSERDLGLMLDWELILVTVPDKTMAVQLNKLSAYVPNLKFVVDGGVPLFTIQQGLKGRRVWKER